MKIFTLIYIGYLLVGFTGCGQDTPSYPSPGPGVYLAKRYCKDDPRCAQVCDDMMRPCYANTGTDTSALCAELAGKVATCREKEI